MDSVKKSTDQTERHQDWYWLDTRKLATSHFSQCSNQEALQDFYAEV